MILTGNDSEIIWHFGALGQCYHFKIKELVLPKMASCSVASRKSQLSDEEITLALFDGSDSEDISENEEIDNDFIENNVDTNNVALHDSMGGDSSDSDIPDCDDMAADTVEPKVKRLKGSMWINQTSYGANQTKIQDILLRHLLVNAK